MTKNIIDSSSVNDGVNEIDLGRLISYLVKRKWIIITSVIIAVILGVVAAITMAPNYKVNSVIQINTLPDDMYVSKSSSAEEIQWVTSRNVIEKTVNSLNKTINVEPLKTPVIGKILSKFGKKDEPEITISRLEVPRELVNEKMLLTIDAHDQYKVEYNSQVVLTGTVGKLSQKGDFALLLDGTTAPAGSKFTLVKNNLEDVISDIQKRMNVVEQAKDSGLLTLSLTGNDEGETIKLLNGIVKDYVENKNKRNISDADQSLVGVKQRLTQVNNDLDLAERKINELNADVSSGKSLSKKQLQDAVTAMDQIDSNNGYKEIGGAGGSANETNLTALPGDGQQILLRLTREILTGQELNVQLENQRQRLELIKSASVNDVRVVDPAFEENSSTTVMRIAIVLIAAIAGFVVSSGYVFSRVLLNSNLQSPSDVESLGFPVCSAFSLKKLNHKNNEDFLYVLNKNQPDLTEKLRTARTNLSYLMERAGNNIVVITSPKESQTKNIVISNLAVLFAKAGKKTLLIDNDALTNDLKDVFNIDAKIGLAEYLNGKANLDELIQTSGIDNLNVIPTGSKTEYSSDALLTPRYVNLIEDVRSSYDVILINCSPVLISSDVSLIGRFSQTRALVVESNRTTADELTSSGKRLAQNGVNVETVIFCES